MNRSPLRYPGGKSTITPLMTSIIQKKTDGLAKGFIYIEPFAGGAGVAVNLLLEGVVSKIVINDYDTAIYSFWRALKDETDALIELIKKSPISIEEWHKQRNIYTTLNHKYSIELGFATFFLNRTNHSGILNARPIGGYEQSGKYHIDARYNRDALISRIQNIAKHKKNISIHNKEIRSFISRVMPKYEHNAFSYFDPPYFAHGKRLYKNFLSHEDHVEIASCISKNVACDWIITYDDSPQILSIYNEYQYVMKKYTLNYSAANKGKGSELIIFKSPHLLPLQREIDSNLSQFDISEL